MLPRLSFPVRRSARHRITTTDGVEWIVLPAARSWFLLPLCAVWLAGWSWTGVAMLAALARGVQLDLPMILLLEAGWAIMWMFTLATFGWQIAGRTWLGVHDGVLVHRWTMPLLSETRRYDAARVRNLRTVPSRWAETETALSRSPYPPLFRGGGSLAFDYGAKTVSLLPDATAAESRTIARWLARRLPAGEAAG